MAISTEIVGRTFGPLFVRDYTFKDLEICALGCGAGWDGKTDLEYVNEHDAENPRLQVLPIFGVPLTVNEEMTTMLDYGFDYSGSLHYGIDAYFHAPFKMNDHVETYVTQEAIWDRGEGRGSLSKQVGKSYSADGVHLCTVETYDCCIYDGGFGGERPPKDVVEYPDREPDLAYEEVTRWLSVAPHLPAHGRLAPAAHRLGLHRADRAGAPHQPRCLHGRHRHAPPHRAALIGGGSPERLRRFRARFTSPVLPGTRHRRCTQVWKMGEGRGPLPRGGRGRWGGPAVSELLPRRVGIGGRAMASDVKAMTQVASLPATAAAKEISWEIWPARCVKRRRRTMDDVAMTPFLRKITFFSSGGSFLDGYVLSLIGVALTQIVRRPRLT